MRTLPVLTFALLSALPCPAADWPQFLGPQRDSTTTEKIPAWKEKPKELWKQPVGEAHSSPVVANGTVYAFYKLKDKEEEALAAFDAKTGEKKWEKAYGRTKFTTPFGAGPQGTPAVDGDRVYTYGSTGLLTCWDAKTGERKWQTDTAKEFSPKKLMFGVATSPTVVGNHVIVMVGGKGSGIVGFEKDTGKVAWQSTNDTASYASPIVIGDKSPEVVFLTADNVRAVTASTGKEGWKFPFVDAYLESSTTPVKVGDLYVVSPLLTAWSVSVASFATSPATSTTRPRTCFFSDSSLRNGTTSSTSHPLPTATGLPGTVSNKSDRARLMYKSPVTPKSPGQTRLS
jgi:outer membrane protein assembly factor BamB